MKRFQEKTCRIERIISMEGAVGDGSVNEELKDFFRDNEDELIVKVFGELPDDLEDGLGDSWMMDSCIAEFVYQQGKTGFLCEFACPEKTPTPSGGYRFSWGCYYTQWVYGKTMEESLNAGFAWVDGMNVKNKAKEA